MFSKFFNKNNNALDYSELVPLFKQHELEEFVYNPLFIDKYKNNKAQINAFIFEIRKNNKTGETIKLINKYIINLESPDMLEIISLYMGKNEEQRKDFFTIIDTIYKYNRTEERINNEIEIDQEYNRVKTGFETHNGIPLDDLYNTLQYPEKAYLNKLLATQGGWDTFVKLFGEGYHISFKYLIRLLNTKSVDADILNTDVASHFDEEDYREFVFTLLSNKNNEVVRYIKVLISNNRYDLIHDMIEMNLLADIVSIKIEEETDDLSLIQSIEDLKKKQLVNNYN